MKVKVSHQSSEHKFSFVSQFYKENLRSVIFKDSSRAPAKASTGEVIDAFLKWAKEIANGLMYIHERGLIHKHLKLENILVRINDDLLVLWIYFSLHSLAHLTIVMFFNLNNLSKLLPMYMHVLKKRKKSVLKLDLCKEMFPTIFSTSCNWPFRIPKY